MAPSAAPVNATAAALLGLLHEGPATGGELIAAAHARHGGYFGLTRSQVYRELPAMADAGLLRLGKQGAAIATAHTPQQKAAAELAVAHVRGR